MKFIIDAELAMFEKGSKVIEMDNASITEHK